jgi:RHS repeat-associated protein
VTKLFIEVFMKLQMIATDAMESVVGVDTLSANMDMRSYTPYGENISANRPRLGFNGECVDLLTGVTHLGNGYRAYNPVLLRFQAPDSLSPFGDGGINPYAYCEGDPVNRSDPSGHMSTDAKAGVGIAASIVGLGLAVFGGFAAISAAKGTAAMVKAATVTAMTVLPGLAGLATGVASAAVDDPELAEQLGWASLGLGAVSLIAGGGMAKYGHGKKASSTNRPNPSGNELELTVRSEHLAPGHTAGAELRRAPLTEAERVEQRRRALIAHAERERDNPHHQVRQDRTVVENGKIGRYELLDNGAGNVLNPSIFVPYEKNDARRVRYLEYTKTYDPPKPRPLNIRPDPNRRLQ